MTGMGIRQARIKLMGILQHNMTDTATKQVVTRQIVTVTRLLMTDMVTKPAVIKQTQMV